MIYHPGPLIYPEHFISQSTWGWASIFLWPRPMNLSYPTLCSVSHRNGSVAFAVHTQTPSRIQLRFSASLPSHSCSREVLLYVQDDCELQVVLIASSISWAVADRAKAERAPKRQCAWKASSSMRNPHCKWSRWTTQQVKYRYVSLIGKGYSLPLRHLAECPLFEHFFLPFSTWPYLTWDLGGHCHPL